MLFTDLSQISKMPLDTFICGTCLVSFNDIEQFILHKNEACTKPNPQAIVQVTDRGQQQSDAQTNEQDVAMETESSEAGTSMETYRDMPEDTEILEMSEIQKHVATEGGPLTETFLADASSVFQGDHGHQTVIILQGDMSNLNVEGAGQILVKMTEDLTRLSQESQTKKRKGRGPGRPKKSDVKPAQDPVVKKAPEIGQDGRLLCTRCKRTFTKERVFNAHRCPALSEFVDFSTKETLNLDPDDNHLPQDDLEDSGALEFYDNDSEFKIYGKRKKGDSESSDESYTADKSEEKEEEVKQTEEASGETTQEGKKQNKEVSGETTHGGSIGRVEVEASPDIEENRTDKETDLIPCVPIFLNENEKAAFEASLNIDLTGVDHMFRIHCIEQELNQNASQLSRFSSNHLSLYSCNTCDKVFKSLSHMRFHVLTHTSLKPYKCIKCSYCSNSRGNLYTHMRKHTGQYYRCKQCKFKTVNKSHLLEHEMTHVRIKKICNLCKKQYNTVKSLMSHIRKYHDTPKGKEYLATFMQGRDMRGSTVIHQCHVCNRKFKKKMDRDRHLFVHDIKDLPNTQHCDLCDYTASRPKYLEKHFQKHRCIYRCCKCNTMFLSSVRLVEHLTSTHIESQENKSETWEALFEASIDHSLYLPEPDQVLTQGEKELVNLPAELSESRLDQLKLQNSGEDDLTNRLITSADDFINKVPAQPHSDMASAANPETSNSNEIVIEHGEEIPMEEGGEMSIIENTESETNQLKTEMAETVTREQQEAASQKTHTKDSGQGANNKNQVQEKLIDVAVDKNKITPNEQNDEETLIEAATEADKTADATDIGAGVIDEEEGEEGSMLEETNMTEEELLGMKGSGLRGAELVEKLGYLPMTLQIFQKMRETFGTEECEFCGRLFFSRVDYEPHVRTHTGDKPHMCQKCGFCAITQDNLKRHIEKEHDKLTYQCKECDYVSYSRTQLWNHSMKHKGLKGVECSECLKQFETLKELRSHAALAHPSSSFEELKKLVTHKHKVQGKLGRRSYKCPYCDKVFFRASSEIQKHLWIHEGIKPFKCPICPHACRSKNNLQAHMLRHSKDKPFLCGDCGKAYKSKTALRWHVRSHADGKLFKCDRCPYEATQRSHLKRHLETHQIVKKFSCTICDFSANTIGYLKIHYSRFHKDVDPSFLPSMGTAPVEISQVERNVFKCLSCDYLFGNMTDLKRHLKSRHHVNVQELQKFQDEQVAADTGEMRVVQIGWDDGNQSTSTGMQVDTEPVLQEQVVTDDQLDEKTASAVTILQQIIDMTQAGSLPQQVDDGSILQPETIIVQDGEEMYVSADSTTEIDGNQYVIQYITPQEGSEGFIEVQGDQIETQVLSGDIQTEIVNS